VSGLDIFIALRWGLDFNEVSQRLPDTEPAHGMHVAAMWAVPARRPMNVYAAVNGLNALGAALIAFAILLSRIKQPVHLAFAGVSLIVALWTGANFLWSLQTTPAASLFWIQMSIYPVCLAHAVTFHFALLFTQTLARHRRALWTGYASGLVLLLINARNGFVASVRPKPPFALYPQASEWLGPFILIQVLYLALSLFVMARSIRPGEPPRKTRLHSAVFFMALGWTGAWTNWCYYYDGVPIPPVGNVAVLVSLLAAAYLIFKQDILELHLAAQKTVVYTLLTLCLTLIYTLFVILSERLFQRWIGYSSLVGSVLAGLTIAVAFNPLRERIITVVDRFLFGTTLLELSTENQRMREELLQQDRLKAIATLAAGMAHEIKNPLTSIKVFAEYLPTRYDEPEFRHEFRQVVLDEVQRIDGILRQLLEFSKPQPPVLNPLPIVPVLEEILHLLGETLRTHGIEVATSYEADPVVLIDKHQIRQALLNIVLNSMQAMPNGGLLRVETSLESQQCLRLTIEDTGTGIEKHHLPHVFDPFFTTKEAGTGLGLSIVHAIIVKNHGGDIRLASDVGKGTVVQLRLRCESAAHPRAEVSA